MTSSVFRLYYLKLNAHSAIETEEKTMTTRQQAQELLMRLPENELQKVLQYMLSLSSETVDSNVAFDEENDRRTRMHALAELRRAREELIKLNINWKAELDEALKERYGI